MKITNSILLVLIFFCSCFNSEKKPKKTERTVSIDQLLGKWEVDAAKRDGHITESVNGAAFSISENGQIITNLLGTEQTFNYDLKDTILNTSGFQNIIYEINSITDSTLELSTNIQSRHFLFNLSRSE